jgi:hypothetical protein
MSAKENIIERIKHSQEVNREAERRITDYWVSQGYSANQIVSA